MVLIEGTNPDAWRRLGPARRGRRRSNQLAVAPVLARLGIFRLGLIRAPGPDPDLPPRARAELQAFFNSSTYLDTVRAVDTVFAVALDQVRHARGSTRRRWRLYWAARATAAWNPYATCSGSRPRSRPTAARTWSRARRMSGWWITACTRRRPPR